MAISFLQEEFLRVIVPSNEYYYDDHCAVGGIGKLDCANLCSLNLLDASGYL